MTEEDAIEATEITSDLPEETPGMALELRHPGVPATVDQIAALGADGIKIVKARHQVLDSLRAASILMTYPEDWLLFRGRDGEIKCYLQDAGCDRIAPLWGIEVFDIQPPERLPGPGDQFCWIQIGSGRCAMTNQVVERMEGMRDSTDDIAKNYSGVKKEYIVRKSARANLDGSILRELSGFKTVPLAELVKVAPDRDWEGRGSKGKGFGSSGDRAADRQGEVDMSSPVPPCAKCGGPMWDNRRDKRSDKAPDFKCKKKGQDPNCDGAQWLPKKPASAPPPSSAGAPPPPPQQRAAPAPQDQQDDQPATAAPSGGTDAQAAEETRLRKVIRAQFKGLGWLPAKQKEFLVEYAEASNLPEDATLDNFKLDSLTEMHEDLKKGGQ